MGMVFDIKRGSIKDGPGIRTSVFLKGCPLRCAWCHNPESQDARQQTTVAGDETCGSETTVEDVLRDVRRDKVFYEQSGGGMTLTGGEPMMQVDFAYELASAAKREGISVAVDTCGYAPWTAFERILPVTDLFLYDLKCMDAERHRKLTGVDNALILENLAKLDAAGRRLWIRAPLVHGLNDADEDLAALRAQVEGLKNVERFEICPYHPIGLEKYAKFGMTPPYAEREQPSAEEVRRWEKSLFGTDEKEKEKDMTTRKNFITGVLAAGVAPTIVPSTVFGANAPSNRITVGGIGVGGIGFCQLPQIRDAGFEVVALCDLDWDYSKRTFDKFPQARKYKDYRELLRLEGDRVDAVYCGCPDHWHALVSLAAIAQRKHLCCVKPLTRFVDECRIVVKAAREAGIATQVTANSNCDEASMRLYEYLNAGIIGDVVEAHAWSRRPVWPQGMVAYADWEDPIPEGFDWNMWCGPAKRIPFASKWGKHAPYEKMSKEAWCGDAVYHPFNFRGWFEYGAGALGDMGCHRANTLYKALDLKWPTHVEASCSRVSEVAFPLASMVTYDYPVRGSRPECRVVWYDGGLLPPKPKAMGAQPMPMEGVLYVGTKGTILFNSNKPAEPTVMVLDPVLDAKAKALPATLPRRKGWMFKEWLEACQGGEPATCNFDFAQYITEFTHLGNLAIRTGKPIEFDPVAMKITNGNEAADKLLHSTYENGWKLKG